MQDTPDNLQQYPQQRGQQPGTSTTSLRLVVLLALATGVALDAAAGPYKGKGSGELSLLAQLLAGITAGDVLVADANFCCFALLALLRARQAHGCVHLHTGRYRRGQSDDCQQTWNKPRRPEWIDEKTWADLPAELTVRLVRTVVRQRGYRPKEVCVVTTLLDEAGYPKEEVALLYKDRWNGELDLRALKQTLGLKVLRCKSPEMVKAELWAHLLGYNLLRCVMAQAAWDRGLLPRQLSFSGAARTVDEFRWLLCCSGRDSEQLGGVLSVALGTHRVGKRPGRYEPREVKHRQRKYPELSKPRQQRREELAAAPANEAKARKNEHGRH